MDRTTANGATRTHDLYQRDNYYGFGELFVPVVADTQRVPFVHRLTITGAVRYEDYPDLDRVATPKIGVNWEPSSDFDLRASWGKSFKAPTLYQQYQNQEAYLVNASSYGVPGTRTALLLIGGNRALVSERATSFTGTIGFHPRAIEGLTVDVSYFDVSYKQRVTQAVASATQALTTRTYEQYVARNPSAAQQAAAIAAAPAGLTNISAYGYDPANVIAIVDERNQNVVGQQLRGFDFSGSYRVPVQAPDELTLSASASYLLSKQQATAANPMSACRAVSIIRRAGADVRARPGP